MPTTQHFEFRCFFNFFNQFKSFSNGEKKRRLLPPTILEELHPELLVRLARAFQNDTPADDVKIDCPGGYIFFQTRFNEPIDVNRPDLINAQASQKPSPTVKNRLFFFHYARLFRSVPTANKFQVTSRVIPEFVFASNDGREVPDRLVCSRFSSATACATV